MITLLQQDIAF